MPGVSIHYGAFLPLLDRAVSRGFVSQMHAFFVRQGLRWGFDLGFSPDELPGNRFFKNYKSATDASKEVSENIHGRLRSHKSYQLFRFNPATFRSDLSSFLPSWCVFPLGAVPKSSEPGAFRPISDHSMTGLNDASSDSHLRHSLRTVPEIGRLLNKAFHMAVHDIDAAFPLLPLSPILWPFFLFVWTSPFVDEEERDVEWLCWHVCGDFGAKVQEAASSALRGASFPVVVCPQRFGCGVGEARAGGVCRRLTTLRTLLHGVEAESGTVLPRISPEICWSAVADAQIGEARHHRRRRWH